MSGFKKRIYLYLCILLSVLCLGLFAVEHSSKKGGTVYAETAVFQMADGVAYRNCWSESHCGLTYSATLNKAYYDNFVSTNAVTHDVSVNLLVVPYSYVTSLAQTTVSKYATAKASILSGDYVKAFEEATTAGASFWYGVVDHIYDLDNIATDGTVQLRGGLKTIQVENMNRRYFGVYYLEGKKADNTVVRSYADYASTASGSTHQEKAGSNANSFAYVVSSLSTANRNEWEVKNLTTFLKHSVEGALKASDSSEYNAKFSLEQFNAKGVNELVKAEIDDITYGDDYFTSKVYGALVKSDGSSDLKDITDKLDFNLQWAMNANSGVTLLSSPKQTINVQDVKGTDYTKATLTLGGNNLAVNFNVKPLTLSSSNSTATVSDYQVSKLSEISSLNVQATVKVSPSGKRTSEKTYTFTPSISGSGLGEYTATVTGSGKFGGQISSLFNILGILNVDNISTYNGFYAKTSPTFPTSTDGITYSYDSSKLSVEGNKFTGKVNGTHTVTASIKNGVSTTFTVNVVDGATDLNSYFLNKLDNYKTAYDSFVCDKADLTMFIGDSFFDTQFFSDFYTRFADYDAYTFGISSSQARQWEWYVQKLYELNPKNVVIHIGTNDIFDDGKGKDEVVARLKRLFTNLHENLPNANVYWFSIEPRRGSSDAGGNAIAVTVNDNIKTFLTNNSTFTKFKYVDSYTFFNASQTDLYYYDTVHPSVYMGYNKLMEFLYNSGHRFSNNTNFNGCLSLGSWSTTTSDNFNTSKMIYLARDKFLYKTTMNVSSYATNAHVTLNLNHSMNNRFLLWDQQSQNKFYYTGAGNGTHVEPEKTTINNYAVTGQTIEVAVLKTERHAYMFIDGVLQSTLLNAPYVYYFTVGTQSCSVTLSNNKVYSSSHAEYSTYLAKYKVADYQSQTGSTASIVNNCTGTESYTTTAGFNTVNGTSTFGSSTSINGASGNFVLGFDFKITEYDANAHITINLNGSANTRFLIWNCFTNDGKFYFNGLSGGEYVSSQYAQKDIKYHADILVNDTLAYMFINGALQTIYKLETSVSSLTLGSELCSVQFSNIHVRSSSTGTYNTMLASVGDYTTPTSGNFRDVGTSFTIGSVYDWNTTTSDTFAQSKGVPHASGKFLVTFTTKIISVDKNQSTKPHLTFNLNNSGNTRFLLWDHEGDGLLRCFGFFVNNSGAVRKNGITDYVTCGEEVEVAILVAENHAYFFVNGDMKLFYTNVPDVTSFSIGSEWCSAAFYDVKVYGESSSAYTTKKNSVSTYESATYNGVTCLKDKNGSRYWGDEGAST